MRISSSLARTFFIIGFVSLFVGCRAIGGRWMNNSGMGYYEKGNYDAARHEFERAVADDPYHPDYRHNLAMAMQKQGDIEGAERVLRHNLTVDPMHQPTYHALTNMLMVQQRSGEAQELLTELVETQPYMSNSHHELAMLQRELGQPITLSQYDHFQQGIENPEFALASFSQPGMVDGLSDPAMSYQFAGMSRRQMRRAARSQSGMMTNSMYDMDSPFELDDPLVSYSDGAMPMIDPWDRRAQRMARRTQRRGLTQTASYPLPTYGLGNTTAMSPIADGMLTANGMTISSPPITGTQIFMNQNQITDQSAILNQATLPNQMMLPTQTAIPTQIIQPTQTMLPTSPTPLMPQSASQSIPLSSGLSSGPP